MKLQQNSLWVLVLAILLACVIVHAATPYSFYEFESKDFISSHSRPVKVPDGYGLNIPIKNIVGSCNINETIYIATDSSIYRMLNPTNFVKIIDVGGISKDMTCGEKYLFYVKSGRTSIGRIDLTTGASFTITPIYISQGYEKIRGLSYRNGYLYFTHWDLINRVSGTNSIAYQLWFEKILIDGTGMTKLYTADTFNLYSSGNNILYRGLKSLLVKTTAGDVIYGLDYIGISLYVDTDETMYFMIDGDYSMTKQKRVYKIVQPSPTDAELVAWCSYSEIYDVDGDATNSKCGSLSSYFNVNSKKYFLSNNNIKFFTGDATTGTISTFLSFERNLVSATQLDSKNLIVTESSSVYLVDLDLLTSTKIAGGDVENIGDYDSYKNAYFNNINKIAKKGNYLYIAEGNGKRIRKVDLVTNIITTVASIAPYFPRTLTVDDSGILFCMATDGGRTFLLKITQTGSVTIPFGGASTAGSDGTSASQCGTSCFWGELKFGGFSSKTQSMYAIQVSSNAEYLCKHSATNQAKSCNKLGDLSNVGARFVLNVAVAGDYVYVLKKNLIILYTLDLSWAGEIYPAFTFASAGSIFYVSDRDQVFVTDPFYTTFYTVVKDKGYLTSDNSIKSLMAGASDLLLLDDGSIMYVHTPSNSIKILSPKSCISAIPGIDFEHKCEIQCNGKYVSNDSVCSGRGQCAFVYDKAKASGSGVCKCRTGLSGNDCETVTCPSCTITCFGKSANDSSICSGHGTCDSLDKCTCTPNHSGNQCQYTSCNGIPNTNSTVCSGNGVCSGFDTCTCNSGFNGSNCEQTTCFETASSDPNVCGGHGKCVALDTCKCDNGYSGNQCQAVSCFGISASNSLVCSGHGACSKPDTCTCTNSFSGSICNITTCGSMKSDNPDVCGSVDAGWCDSKDNCACKPGMVRTDSLTCKRPCGSCTGFSANKLCQSSYCSPVSCSSANTYGVSTCTTNGMYYCGSGGVCAFECASDSDCKNEYRFGKCDTDSSSASYRTCKNTCSSNSDCTSARFPLCVDYGAKGSRCEKTPCLTASNCTDPAYPFCIRSSCDNVECSSDSDCASVPGKPYCNKNGTCAPKECLVSSECASTNSKYCSYMPLNGTSYCSSVECTQDANCKNVNGKPTCSSNTCVAKSCSVDKDCPQNGVNKYCINSQCTAYYPPCVSTSDCSSYLDTPTCNTTLNICVPTMCKYGKNCPTDTKGCRVTKYSTIFGNTTKVCAIECETDSHCSNTPGKPRCSNNVCVAKTCSVDADCPQDGANKYCKSGTCQPGCLVDNDCYGTFNVCMAKNGYECATYNLNDICETKDDCPSKFGTCMLSPVTGLMNCGKECIADTNCTSTSKPFCDFADYSCQEKSCLGDYGCLGFNWSPMCSSYKCSAECSNDFDCAGRPGTQKCDTTKFKCVTQTCTDDESCKSYGGGYFPHCVNGMCRHECTKDLDCSLQGKGKCQRPANAKTTDGGICVAKSCSSNGDCTALGNRNTFCVNSVCNYECSSNADCNGKIDGNHVCKDNKCINYCSIDQPCTSPWFNQCLSNYCFATCSSGRDCISVQTPKCLYNSTNRGAMCVEAPCSSNAQCVDDKINWVYSKCLNNSCAYCKQNSDCPEGDQYYCGLNGEGYTYCTYQRCSSNSDCPGYKKCWKATMWGVTEFKDDPEAKVCLDYNCDTDADCGFTVNKHKCVGRKCSPACVSNTDCSLGSPICNLTSNDCTYKSCNSSSDCNYGGYQCREGLCKPECETHSECSGRDDGTTACVNGKCTNYCDSKVGCSSTGWFSTCSRGISKCIGECIGDDCKSMDRTYCLKNATNGGAKCVASVCSKDADCSNPLINIRYSKCIRGSCAACSSSSVPQTAPECPANVYPSQQFCELDDYGYTVCNYKPCSNASECPTNFICDAVSKLPYYNPNLISNTNRKVCIDGCLTDSDCKNRVYGHKCYGNKCVANCNFDYQCYPAQPVCNMTSGDCTFKSCATKSDCSSNSPNTFCRAGLCKPECDVNSDCTTASKPRCDAGVCAVECTLDSHCNSSSACDTSNNICRLKMNECSTNADCSSTYNKHKCAAWKECVPFCTSNSSCTDAFRPYCNATGECELKPCFSNSDCGASYPTCNNGTCDIECTSDIQCKDPFKTKCTNNLCGPECSYNYQCGNNYCVNTRCRPCSSDGFCDGSKGCAVHLDGSKSCDLKLCNSDTDCKGLLYRFCKPATTFGYGISSMTSNASATVCSPECTTSSHCKDPKYPNCKSGICSSQCSYDYECSSNGNKRFCYAGTCSSCDQVVTSDICASSGKACYKDASGNSDCAYIKCESSSDCAKLGQFSTCMPFSKTQSGTSTFYPSNQTVCFYQCSSASPSIPCTDPLYPRCDAVTKKCLPECSTSSDCTSGKVCVNNVCTTGCTDNSQCTGANVCQDLLAGYKGCSYQKCSSNSECTNPNYPTCVSASARSLSVSLISSNTSQTICSTECFSNNDCKNPNKPRCSNSKCVEQCFTHDDCFTPDTKTPYCKQNKCVARLCENNNDCLGMGFFNTECKNGTCKEQCSTSLDCPASNPICTTFVRRATSKACTNLDNFCNSGFSFSIFEASEGKSKCYCSPGKSGQSCLIQTNVTCIFGTSALIGDESVLIRTAAASNPGYCNCFPGYTGTTCNVPVRSQCDKACVYGQCVGSGAIPKCICDAGYDGDLCDNDIANPCTLRCVNGKCSNVNGVQKCVCTPGFEGDLCEKKVPNPCLLKCVNGQCNNETGIAKCICNTGYEGDLCEKKVPNPCLLKCVNGQCNNETGIAKCNCNTGFEGELCEKQSTTPCTLQCVNGQCSNVNGIQKCICTPGFEGDLCEKKSANPCNLRCINGQCNNSTGVAKCVCYPGFEGELCDKVVPNPCTLKCINGQCNNATGIAKCICNNGYEGELCEKQSTTPCTLQCVNGQCSKVNGAMKCICVQGFEGDLCEKKSANPCNLRCVNGQCNNSTGIAKCVCNSGFEGELCEKQSTTPCTLQCVNGQCSNINGIQKCICTPGFEGDLCEKKILNPCNLRCVSGQCSNTTGIVKCVCYPGFEGELCDKVVPNPCTLKCVNGLCSNTTGIAKCMCNTGFEGDLCEKQSCNLKCAYGQCAIVNGIQKCMCNPGFEGVLCDTKIPNPCNLKCVNGQCSNTTGLAKCICSSGFEGDLCDKRVCSRQCLNGGSCKFDAANNQICACINGYTGAMCQISPDAQEVACKLSCLNGGVCMNTTGIAKCLCTSDLFVGDLCSSCKTGFILQKGVCVCPYGFNNENGNCVRLPADCSGGCGQYGQCLYKDTTGYQGYCKCQENYVTELSTKPCGACISGYVLNAQGKCVKVCPPEFTGDDCTNYVPAASCVPIPPSGLSFCKAHLQGLKVLNTHYASGASNATDARLLITNAMTQLDKSAKSLYDLNIAKIQKQGVCNSTCEESNARLACYSVIQSCNSPASPETKLCKSVCNYIAKDIRTYYPDFESPCSNLEDTSCFYGAYLPPDTSCYGKLYTDSAVCGGRGDCVGTDKCICKSGFTGSQCTSAVCFGKSADQADVCSGNGACSGPNRCTCNSGYTGLECNVVTCNGKSENEGGCSYRGVCSSVTRACVCNGNFAGSSCLKCKEGFTGPQCDIPVCNGISAIDRSVCGGRGTCKSEDGVPKCQCNDGYDGSNCQTFVCNGTDRLSPNVCSSKGKCVSYDTCSCESKNFNPATYCSTCLPSFDGANCENKKCTPEETCRGRGSCDSQFKCVCSDKFTGPFCERCVDGFVGDQCQYQCSPDTCNRRGTCANDGSCVCSDNASGANCETCKPGWFGDKCDFSVDASSFGFSENGDSITGTVMTSLRKRIDCSSLIVNSQLLGTNPVCSLNGEKSLLTITLGTSSSISIGGILTVRKYFESELTSNVVVAQLNYKAISPVATLVADKSTISKACGAIYLDASGSSSLDRRSLIYSWTTTVAPSSTEVLDSIISKQTTPGVKFTASDLDVGTYVVQVTVKSSFSLKESVASVTFNVIAATPPTISIKNGLESSMVIGSPYIISPIVTFPSCYKGSGSLVYTYTLESGSPLVLKQKNELLVFSNDYTQLTEEGDYVFKLSAKEEGSPEATVTFKVTATALPLKVAFNIRDMTQSFEDPVSFAITKQDPSNPNEAGGQVSISCANIDTASTCDGFVDGAQNIDQTTLKLQKTMSPGVYAFTATYTKSTRTSTASVKVTVSDQSKSTVLRVSISVPKDADLVAIDPSSDLILQATSLDTLTSARLFTWSSSDFTFDASIDISKQYIVIPKSLLAPGASYTVTVKVVDGQKSGEATLSFTVNSPPTMGTLDISPKSGIAVTDEFKISCGNGWSDPQLPLTFAFYSKASTDTNWKLLKEKSETRSFGTSLPAGELEIKVVVFDSKGASTETTTSVSVSLPKDTASALTSLSSGTMTTSSVSSALSLLETVKSDDPEQMKQFAELGKQIVLSYFEQKATEESLSSQTSTSTSSTLSVISSISSCVNNLPDDTIRMIIEKFKSATNGASTSSSISLSDEEIKSSTDSASTIQTYVSGSLGAKRSLFTSSFTLEDLNKIDQVKNNLMNIKLKNAVPDMPAVRGNGIKSLSYVRLVNIASLNGLFESLAENGVTSFNLSSVFSEIPQVSSLDSVKISMKAYENSNTTFKSTSKIFDFVVSSSDNTNVVIKYSKPIAQLIIEKANSSARAVQEPKCNSVVDGAITESSSCTILGTYPDSYVIAVSSTGSYVIGTTSNDVQPGTSTTTETPTTPTKPITNTTNLDYIALILLIIPVILIIVGVVGVIVCVLRRKKVKEHAAPQSYELKTTV